MKSDHFRHLRRDVLRMSQVQLGDAIGVTKFTIINQEKAGFVRPIYAAAILGVLAKEASEMARHAEMLQASE